MYEFFEHTADLGMRVEAADLDSLFRDSARGLYAMILEQPPAGARGERHELHVEAECREHLLFDWLNELLYLFETRRLVFGELEVHVGAGELTAVAFGRVLDPERDVLLREVKAITYHGLRVERAEAGWVAEVIVDI